WPGRVGSPAWRSGGTGIPRAGSGACSASQGGEPPGDDRERQRRDQHRRQRERASEHHVTEIRAATILPARRVPIDIQTADGLNLVGELALPPDRDPVATLVCLHPLPTHGGMMDSHLYKKASYRLPALAGLAVVRFNTRGTESERGRSDGEFGGGES